MKPRGLFGALIGVLAAAIAVGTGELVAAMVRPAAAPIVAVANRVILLTPESTKRSAIESFGGNDKTVLLWSIYAGIAVFGAAVGTLAMSNVWYGVGGFVVFGAFGCYCALTQNASRGSDVIPSIVATVVGAAFLWWLARLGRTRSPANADADGTDRRRFLVGSAATAGLAAISGFGGRAAIHSRFDVTKQRNALTLPRPASPAPVLARGTDLGKSNVPFVTPAGDFYRVDTAIDVPQVDPKSWRLRIHGMVDREVTLSYDELLARPLIERWITLCCVSNDVGGTLVGNARWLGARLADVLREAGIQPADADQLLLTSADGMTIGAPTQVVMDGRDAMIAVGMNGDPLPTTHGFPARIVVPGLYGYVSACKWVTDIEATTFQSRRAYWVDAGWDQQTDIKLESRIDTPRYHQDVTVGTAIPIAGVAWDQHVGVSKVEVQVDDGPWRTARLASVPSTDTWRQWVVPWTPPHAGMFTLSVRATDGSGRLQTSQRESVFPSGATGWERITVRAVDRS